MAQDEGFAEAWREHRAGMVDLAFRMLGDIGEAEDVVQEAFSRLAAAAPAELEDTRAWLVVVTSRLCLDQLRSARSRRERPQEPPVIESSLAQHPAAGPPPVDPADQVTLDDRVQEALGVVLERLSPSERVVLVLHDVFQLPFDDIARTVGRAAPACRQIALRARRKVVDQGAARRFEVNPGEHRRVTERFIAACASGSLERLMDVLDPQAWGLLAPFGRTGTGADVVAANLARFWGPWVTLVSLPAGGTSLLAFVDRELVALLELAIEGDRVLSIRITADPAKLPQLMAARPEGLDPALGEPLDGLRQ